jgi:hypothetical protein
VGMNFLVVSLEVSCVILNVKSLEVHGLGYDCDSSAN